MFFQGTEGNLENSIASSIPNCLVINRLLEGCVIIYCRDRRRKQANYHCYCITYSLDAW